MSFRRVPALATIGIDDDWLTGGLPCTANQRVRVGRIDAVDADGDDLIAVSGECEGFGCRLLPRECDLQRR